MRPLRVGIAGLGRIASLYERDAKARRHYSSLTHAGAYARHPATVIVAGADPDQERRKDFGRRWGVPALYADTARMLAEARLDILSICAHPEAHLGILRQAAGRVPVVFCEKPFTNDSREIQLVLDLQKRTGMRVAVNLYRQYDPSHQAIATRLLRGRWGRVQRVNCFYGKGLRNMGSHALGYLMGIFGAPKAVRVLRVTMDSGLEEPTCDLFLETKDGIPILLQSCDFSHYRLFEFDFICTRGRVQIHDEGLRMRFFRVQANRAESGAREAVEHRCLRSTVGSALYHAVDHLVRLRRDPMLAARVSPSDYLALQNVIEEAQRQARRMGVAR
ncbi:MAG: Gfo/Idh/MocA family oxidoreductase [Elusimicrobia bacterium]|nr:Gfo/Idh/MocA family oxidoreductase [Elusimicrobiota bacterium]